MTPDTNISNPYNIVVLLVVLSLLPFVAIMVSSYVKIVVVSNLIRNALGVQQIPPNLVLNGLAIILSIYIMAPVIQDTYELVQDEELQTHEFKKVMGLIDKAEAPLKGFLMKHSEPKQRHFFLKNALLLWGKERAESLQEESFLVLIPAFTITELTQAFQVGFLIYLPFIAIDLVISNILMAMGMMMVSPMTISLPFKIMLFVLIDGWAQLYNGLILSYQ